jgi:hypothetical protein
MPWLLELELELVGVEVKLSSLLLLLIHDLTEEGFNGLFVCSLRDPIARLNT